MIVDVYKGGLVGVEMLVVGLFELCDMIEEVIEFYLIQFGFVVCIVCGCCFNDCGWCYFGFVVFIVGQDGLFDCIVNEDD